jgi:pyruvate dehydrogenase phosphatase
VAIFSNDPCEDVHTEATLPVPNGWWSLFTVLDGHSGPETAWWLRENLIAAVAGALADLYNNSMSNTNNGAKHEPTSKDIESTLKQTFVQLDDDICKESVDAVFRNDSSTPVADAIHHLAPAYAGSCALLAFYDSHSRLLHVAVTGDSRAVLGRRTSTPAGDTVYETHILSIDQNGYNPAEAARLTAAHPGETVVKDGRVMGMGMARSFGDARWKWNVETQKRLKKEFLGRSVPRGVITPPYLTAEPEVISIEVQPGDFLIMASDGLWECLDNEDAVGLVGWWLGSSASNSLDRSRRRMEEDPLRGVLPAELPVHREPDAKPEVSVRYGQWNKTKSFINQDSNASAHLIRNALGGAHSDLFTALLAMRAPKSRTFR